MPFIGNQPAESYASFETETFSVSATTNYTLSHAVTNENEIRLVINGVVQQPGSGKAYTASGTTLTLSSATASGDSMYAVYLGRALQTVNPPAASVGNSQTAPTIITGQTAETSIADGDTILIHDASASALRKMTKANFVSGIGGTNTPAFNAYLASDTSISNATYTTISMTEDFDTDNAFASNTFTVPSGEGGKYYFNYVLQVYSVGNIIVIARLENSSGTQLLYGRNEFNSSNYALFAQNTITCSGILTLSAGDTVIPRAYATTYNSSNTSIAGDSGKSITRFFGCKLIGI